MSLSDDELENIEAVVFDTNAMGKGHPVLRTLERWAETLSANEIELWIPEPVAWEWASHIGDAYAKVRDAEREAQKRLRQAGVPGMAWPFASRDEAIDYVLQKL